jgi:hypothetical protein
VTRLRDIEVALADRPGALATFGEVLGAAGVSLEGGGVFTVNGSAIAHFLVDDADTAVTALTAAGMGPIEVSDPVMLRLDQGTPGQLGLVARRMAEAGVNLRVQYSDHDHNLVLVPDAGHHEVCVAVANAWATTTTPSRPDSYEPPSRPPGLAEREET